MIRNPWIIFSPVNQDLRSGAVWSPWSVIQIIFKPLIRNSDHFHYDPNYLRIMLKSLSANMIILNLHYDS